VPKVLIVSDSHGLTKEVQIVKERHEGEVDAMIHCGDSELDFDSDEMKGYQKVRGNCDFDERYPEDIDIDVEDMKFLVTHGHLYRIKTTLMPLSYRAEEVGANIICFGHSHMAAAEKIDNRLFINPGSIRLPRGITEKTYAIVSWTEKSHVQVEFLNVEGERIPSMTVETSLQAEE